MSLYTKEANRLIGEGYRRISRKHNIVARFDSPDWPSILSKYFNGRSVSADDARMQDYYLRVITRDQITVSPEVAKEIPTVSTLPVEYDPLTLNEIAILRRLADLIETSGAGDSEAFRKRHCQEFDLSPSKPETTLMKFGILFITISTLLAIGAAVFLLFSTLKS